MTKHLQGYNRKIIKGYEKNIYNKLMIRLDEKDRRDDMLVYFQYFIVLFVLCLVSNFVCISGFPLFANVYFQYSTFNAPCIFHSIFFIIFFSFIKIYTYFFHSVFNYGDLSQQHCIVVSFTIVIKSYMSCQSFKFVLKRTKNKYIFQQTSTGIPIAQNFNKKKKKGILIRIIMSVFSCDRHFIYYLVLQQQTSHRYAMLYSIYLERSLFTFNYTPHDHIMAV